MFDFGNSINPSTFSKIFVNNTLVLYTMNGMNNNLELMTTGTSSDNAWYHVTLTCLFAGSNLIYTSYVNGIFTKHFTGPAIASIE